MIPLAFYSLLITAILLSITVGAIIAFFTNGALSLPIIFIFILIFPVGWNLGKKYFSLKENKKIENKKIFLGIVILINIILILLTVLFMSLYSAGINEVVEHSEGDYRKYIDETKEYPSDNQEKNIDFTEF